jgi:hypothetical protein
MIADARHRYDIIIDTLAMRLPMNIMLSATTRRFSSSAFRHFHDIMRRVLRFISRYRLLRLYHILERRQAACSYYVTSLHAA